MLASHASALVVVWVMLMIMEPTPFVVWWNGHWHTVSVFLHAFNSLVYVITLMGVIALSEPSSWSSQWSCRSYLNFSNWSQYVMVGNALSTYTYTHAWLRHIWAPTVANHSYGFGKAVAPIYRYASWHWVTILLLPSTSLMPLYWLVLSIVAAL